MIKKKRKKRKEKERKERGKWKYTTPKIKRRGKKERVKREEKPTKIYMARVSFVPGNILGCFFDKY